MGRRLTGEEWGRALHTFERTAFRWESQFIYREPYEQGALAQYLRGEEPDMSFAADWFADIRRGTAAGRRYSRVRVVCDPPTDYLKFELAVTPMNIAAGEEIRLLTDDRRQQLQLPATDFWLFDDSWAAVMHFGPEGFEYAEAVEDPEGVREFLEIRDRAWAEATPFGDHMT